MLIKYIYIYSGMATSMNKKGKVGQSWYMKNALAGSAPYTEPKFNEFKNNVEKAGFSEKLGIEDGFFGKVKADHDEVEYDSKSEEGPSNKEIMKFLKAILFNQKLLMTTSGAAYNPLLTVDTFRDSKVNGMFGLYDGKLVYPDPKAMSNMNYKNFIDQSTLSEANQSSMWNNNYNMTQIKLSDNLSQGDMMRELNILSEETLKDILKDKIGETKMDELIKEFDKLYEIYNNSTDLTEKTELTGKTELTEKTELTGKTELTEKTTQLTGGGGSNDEIKQKWFEGNKGNRVGVLKKYIILNIIDYTKKRNYRSGFKTGIKYRRTCPTKLVKTYDVNNDYKKNNEMYNNYLQEESKNRFYVSRSNPFGIGGKGQWAKLGANAAKSGASGWAGAAGGAPDSNVVALGKKALGVVGISGGSTKTKSKRIKRIQYKKRTHKNRTHKKRTHKNNIKLKTHKKHRR